MTAIQTVGVLLLVAVLILAVLNYASIFNISDSLNEIKIGVSKLLKWLVPSDYRVELKGIANVSSVSGDIIYVTADNASGVVGTVTVEFANVPVEIVLEGSKPITVTISRNNCTAAVENIGGNAVRVVIYPAGTAKASIDVSMETATRNDSVAVYYRKL
ncbi:MAG: hypothetical protein QXN35_01015 [Ignisphaera sp.]